MPDSARRKLAEVVHSNSESSRRRCGRKPSPEKRLKILEAAVKLFTSRDYHVVLVEDIADQAGVGKGTVYRYFPTKEALYLELVNLAVDRASEVIADAAERSESAPRRLRRAVAMTLEYFRINEPFLQILWHDKVFRTCRERKDLGKKRAEVRDCFARILAEGIAEGSFRSDMEPAVGAMILMASIQSFLRNFAAQRTTEQMTDQLMSIFVDGAAPRAERRVPDRASGTYVPALDPATVGRLDPLAALRELGGIPGHASDSGRLGEKSLEDQFRFEFKPPSSE
ncbi:MAG: TetR/AcrR family transcriptional regulator [Planctomycetota bacterium]|nr:TetR/AcrR family transcriptional regulator [Planctomycetota bacterium]